MKKLGYMIIIIILAGAQCLAPFLARNIVPLRGILIDVEAAEVIERVAAFVNDDAITLRELNKQYNILHAKDSSITKEMTLNTMINQLLLEKDADSHKITGTSKEDVINKYINIYVRSQVSVKDNEIDNYYNENINNLKDTNGVTKKIEDIRNEIKVILLEKKVNIRLFELLKELKNKSYVRIQLDPD